MWFGLSILHTLFLGFSKNPEKIQQHLYGYPFHSPINDIYEYTDFLMLNKHKYNTTTIQMFLDRQGDDYRYPPLTDEEEEQKQKRETIKKIEELTKFMKYKFMLETLQDPNVSMETKMNIISYTFPTMKNIGSMQLMNGGLMNDWDYDF
jgi:hypothetical protein